MLEVFAQERGRSLSLTTKSDLVARDVELLAPKSAKRTTCTSS